MSPSLARAVAHLGRLARPAGDAELLAAFASCRAALRTLSLILLAAPRTIGATTSDKPMPAASRPLLTLDRRTVQAAETVRPHGGLRRGLRCLAAGRAEPDGRGPVAGVAAAVPGDPADADPQDGKSTRTQTQR
jgi:hypothetical protein